MRKKLVILFGMVLLALVGLILKITVINATEGEQYSKQVLMQTQQQYTSREIPSKRGDIYDRNGNILASSSKVYNVILDCKVINSEEKYVEPTVRALVDIFGADEEEVRTLLSDEKTKDSQYQILMKGVSVDDKKAFDDYTTVEEDSDLSEEEQADRQNVQGVWFEETYERNYPFKSLACDTIGFTFDADTADWGLEGYYNSILTGTDGRQYGYFNDSSDVEQTIIEATDGQSIVSTLDVGAQSIVEKYVNAFQEAMGAENLGVIVEDPSTGEIIAMDGGDRYDLNEPRDMSSIYTDAQVEAMSDEEEVEALNSMWRNYCVTDAYEPGSVVKPIVMAAALEKGAISEDDTFTCDGYQMIGDTQIKCSAYPGAHGNQTLQEVIANSCNDAMMQIAERMGTEEFLETQTLFNLGSRTGIDLPNEGTGIMHTADTMGPTELACSAFGQGFTCTMIQEINAICSVINGGYYYQPHLVSRIEDSNGTVVREMEPTLLKQTVSSSISEDIRSYMQSSVESGTSHYSKVNGYSSGGKTGTAEKFPRGNGKYLVSFVGFAPVDDPAVVIYVVVDEPNADRQDNSAYPQYIAQGILSELLPYLDVAPDEAADGEVPQTELWEGFNGHLKDNELTGLGSIVTRYDENGIEDPEGEYDEDGNYIGPVTDTDSEDEEENTAGEEDTGEEEQGGDEDSDGTSQVDVSDDSTADGISDENVPGPLEDDSDPIEGNNAESDGVTNEEAGLE
ncbi:MAG TPA: cell division protein FtsI [Candidatus Blautia intestinigallinarum]|nr:cell division protein FtsI [Candidatus Blautia intestinigallinarum]